MSSTGKKIITSEEEAKARMAEKRREMKVRAIDEMRNEVTHYSCLKMNFSIEA